MSGFYGDSMSPWEFDTAANGEVLPIHAHALDAHALDSLSIEQERLLAEVRAEADHIGGIPINELEQNEYKRFEQWKAEHPGAQMGHIAFLRSA